MKRIERDDWPGWLADEVHLRMMTREEPAPDYVARVAELDMDGPEVYYIHVPVEDCYGVVMRFNGGIVESPDWEGSEIWEQIYSALSDAAHMNSAHGVLLIEIGLVDYNG